MRKIYNQHCAACHGAKLEGQPNWREKLPNGRMPAPPHDESGHTWHHPDHVLFGITKEGPLPGKYAPPGHKSDMPAFGGALSDDEIWAVLAFIKSHWKTKAAPRRAGRHGAQQRTTMNLRRYFIRSRSDADFLASRARTSPHGATATRNQGWRWTMATIRRA